MEKREYLNEEWYQKVKKKITRTSLIIFIISILIGGSLIATGIIKTDSAKKEAMKLNEERYNTAYKESSAKITSAQQRIAEIAAEKTELNKQYETKQQECDSIPLGAADWFSKANQCNREATAISSKINELKTEEFRLNGDIEMEQINIDSARLSYDYVVSKNYIFLCMLGGGIIAIGLVIALSVYFVAKQREIRAFTIQQSMPIAQETMDKMAPTIGNAAGTIAQGIAKGIKDGLNDHENK